MDSNKRVTGNIDAMDMVVRVPFKGKSSKKFSLRRYEMEFIY